VDSFGADGVAGRGVANRYCARSGADCDRFERDYDGAGLARGDGVGAVFCYMEWAREIHSLDDVWGVGGVGQRDGLLGALCADALIAEVQDGRVDLESVLAIVNREPLGIWRLRWRNDNATEAGNENVAARNG